MNLSGINPTFINELFSSKLIGINMKKQFILTLIFLSLKINQVNSQETLDEIQVLSSSKLINNKLSGGTTHIITKNDIPVSYTHLTLPTT